MEVVEEIREDLVEALKAPYKDDSSTQNMSPLKINVDLKEVEAIEIVKRYFEGLNVKTLEFPKTYCLHITNKIRQVMHQYACHAGLRDRVALDNHKNLALGSMFIETENNKQTFEVLRTWMLSDRFPWKSLVPYMTHVIHKNTGLQTGIILSAKGIDNFQLVKNFCIFLRLFSEKRNCAAAFTEFVLNGLDERDALYLCSFYEFSEKGWVDLVNNGKSVNSYNITGWHWPLTDKHKFSWEHYWTGEPHKIKECGSEYTNCIWMSNGLVGYKQFEPNANNKTAEQILKTFRAWKEKNVAEDYR